MKADVGFTTERKKSLETIWNDVNVSEICTCSGIEDKRNVRHIFLNNGTCIFIYAKM